MDTNYSFLNFNIKKDLIPKLKNIIKISLLSVKNKINMRNKKYSYEIFGYDFILDRNLKPYLLEINTNPGLEDSSPLIEQLVPRMIEDSLKLTLFDLFDIPKKDSISCVDGYSNDENLFEFVCKI